MFASNNFKNQCCLIVMEFSIMFYSRITLALALLLTIFAFEAKADYTPSSKCMSYMTRGTGHVQLSATCCYSFEYCFNCPEPEFGKLLEVYIGEINPEACDGQPGPGTCSFTGAQIFAAIEEEVSSIEFLKEICPDMEEVPPCVGLGASYLYVKVVWPTCWKAKLVSGLPAFDICTNECTAMCVHTYRYCYDPYYDTVYGFLYSKTMEGDILYMCLDCHYWYVTDLGVTLFIPLDGSYSSCFMVCGF